MNKTQRKSLETDSRTVKKLLKKSNRIIATISSHKLPFDFFPSTLNVEESRVTFISRNFLSSQVNGIDIKNISNVVINSSLFFSQLTIYSKTYEENEAKIGSLFTEQAILIRRIIEGLRVFEHNQIDTSRYSTANLLYRLKQLSTTTIEM